MKDFTEYKFFDDAHMRENELQNDIKDMWIRNGVLIEDMDERVNQVLVGVLYKGKVVGIISRGVIVLDNHEELKGKTMAYVREFIDPIHRSIKLHLRLFWSGVDLIESRGVMDGVLFDTENKKFNKPGYTKRLSRKGFTELPTQLDTTVWYKLF